MKTKTKRRILLVDDELTILLTLKAVLEISGFDVETAASAREGRSKIRAHTYDMVITDMRMESDVAGLEVVQAAKKAPYQPAVAMLTAFPLPGSEWEEEGADKMLVKPMNTHDLLTQLEALLASHEAKKAKAANATMSGAENGLEGVAEHGAGRIADTAVSRPAKGAPSRD
ncbi:response regulator [Acidipila sp. EB88]|uniref:response regulator n=1 Tax=Acidipila sp. EB88 TaxID=2305226 RepID=UPI000F5DADAE|nr:response regulator [Acidipila sp. EB88]RRA48430.1 response regulator [Acidipila sp. EB88]